MKVKIFKALWGMDHLPLEQQFKQISEAGYSGIESPMPESHNEPLFRKLIAEYG